MNGVQKRIRELKVKGWTLAAIADGLGVTWYTAQRWDLGQQYPTTPKPVLIVLAALVERKRVPKKRRYQKGTRTRKR